ncbi:2791_t:CDS:2 [Racocetra fulgida]|uniref:2791_t:CDS:1 n=1 Tax=Racocetra fulgida TaxID=60492 RepID=A0A9N8ZTR7_9GLOM|nr:2791_t:CDS:2 [Racocetra fulgida]
MNSIRGILIDVSGTLMIGNKPCEGAVVGLEKLRDAGIPVSDALEDFQGVPVDEPMNAVVMGLSPSNMQYDTLNKAFRILINDPNAPLIALHKAKYFAEPDGLSLGPGPFVSALEYACDGPEKTFFESALKDMGLLETPNQVIMIGDDITQDLGGSVMIVFSTTVVS